jgi:prevent-host-death family protein
MQLRERPAHTLRAVTGPLTDRSTRIVDLVHDLVYFSGMAMVNVHDAKTHFSKLLRRVTAGEEIVIARAGRPVARLVPVETGGAARTLGRYVGKIRWVGDFDESLSGEVLDGFEGVEE